MPVIVLSGSFQREFPEEIKPDRWFKKSAEQVPELLQAVHDLARRAPNFPQVISTPVRTRRNGDGYFVLTCTECLRLFEVTSAPEDKSVERTGICMHCEALVPFLIESSEPS
jgi:hypothetical protein